MSRLPFTTDDVREQCEMFGDAPLAHPLPIRDLLKMCQYIDDLELRHEIDARYIAKIEARMERAEAIIANVREYADRLVPGHMQTSLYVALVPEQ